MYVVFWEGERESKEKEAYVEKAVGGCSGRQRLNKAGTVAGMGCGGGEGVTVFIGRVSSSVLQKGDV